MIYRYCFVLYASGRFQPRQLSQRTTNLVIGTSKTQYIYIFKRHRCSSSLLPRCLLTRAVTYSNHTRSATSVPLSLSLVLLITVIQPLYRKLEVPDSACIPEVSAPSHHYPQTYFNLQQPVSQYKHHQLNFAFYNLLHPLTEAGSLPIISPHFNRDFDR